MAVGSDQTQHTGLHIQQQAVEVITHVLLSHGEVGALDQRPQHVLRHPDVIGERLIFEGWEIRRRQSRQGEAAAPAAHRGLVPLDAQGHGGVIGQSAQDVVQLARRQGNRAWHVHGQFQPYRQLHLQIGGSQGQLLFGRYHQHVAQDRQGLASLDRADDMLQGLEELFALGFQFHQILRSTDSSALFRSGG